MQRSIKHWSWINNLRGQDSNGGLQSRTNETLRFAIKVESIKPVPASISEESLTTQPTLPPRANYFTRYQLGRHQLSTQWPTMAVLVKDPARRPTFFYEHLKACSFREIPPKPSAAFGIRSGWWWKGAENPFTSRDVPSGRAFTASDFHTLLTFRLWDRHLVRKKEVEYFCFCRFWDMQSLFFLVSNWGGLECALCFFSWG